MTDDAPLTEAELARLADGSLSGVEGEAARARIEASPELRARLREQQRAVSLLRATEDITAPASLRASLDALTAPASAGRAGSAPARRRPVLRWRPRLVMGGAAAVAAAIVAVVLATSGSGAPTVPQTAHLALAAATLPAPAQDAANRELLAVRESGIPFPSYATDPAWRATGARRDSLHGRRVTTVFYRVGGGRIGYAIVSGPALAQPSGQARTIGGVRYVLATTGSAKLVTWRRDGHTCVIAGRGVGDRTLLALAGTDERTA
jgi:hypothetical protein